jgi:hypothetical protein
MHDNCGAKQQRRAPRRYLVGAAGWRDCHQILNLPVVNASED